MPKLRILSVVSLAVLAVLLVGVVLRPIASAEQISEVQRAELLQTEDSWIIQLDLFNRDSSGQNYTIDLSVDGADSVVAVFIPSQKSFSYIKHISFAELKEEGAAHFVVSKEGEALPLEDKVYHLRGSKK